MMSNVILAVLLSVDLVVLSMFLVQLALSLRRYHIANNELTGISNLEDTPSVSLCIPARNETHALADCLTAALSSDYPKLEIIVLDDCSQDKTSQIIRGFAHDGVRFVQGKTPSEGWLGKNNAYSALVQEAKGSYLVFMSVDTRLSERTISQLIAYMRLKKLSMVSALPQRADGLHTSALFAPLRYFWQMVLPLRFTTPVATSIWSITRDGLEEVGGVEAYKDQIDIENKLADGFQAEDTYRFLLANEYLRISYTKTWRSQVDTSIRLWYPLLHKSISRAFVVAAAHLVLFALPAFTVLYALMNFGTHGGYINIAWALAVAVSIVGSYLYVTYMQQIKRVNRLADALTLTASLFILPYTAIQEVVIICISFIAYKRGTVDWKGRNICFPVSKRL